MKDIYDLNKKNHLGYLLERNRQWHHALMVSMVLEVVADGLGNIRGAAEEMVFLSMDVLLLQDNATNAATKPTIPGRVGSV